MAQPPPDPNPFDDARVAARRAHGWRILIVDDDPAVRRVLERYLDGVGFEVLVAVDVDDALDRLTGASLSAVVLDLRMPDLTGRRRTGLEVLSYLRLQPLLAATPVIVFTGYAPTPDQQAEIERHGAEVLLKGQAFAGLVDRLDQLLTAR